LVRVNGMFNALVWSFELIITTVGSIVQCYASGGRFDRSSERQRTRGLEIWPGGRRLRHHQTPSTTLA
jgi:hypothetical protein